MSRLYTLLLLCLTFSLPAQQLIDRIEPPSWWTGMNNPTVQLMIHGDDISGLTPVIKYKGVKIANVTKPDNENYLFVDLTINGKTSPGNVTIDFYQGRTLRESHAWKLQAREPGSASRDGFNTSDVVYLLTPDRFANGDPKNDDVPGMREMSNRNIHAARHGGDIEGVREHLNYIHDMGYTVIWMMPVLENDMKRGSYHGYATTDYYKVDPRLGTNEDFIQLVRESKAMGMKHIMDVVPNHCGSEHWWMNDLPFPDWIHKWPIYTQSNHVKSTMLDPHASEYDRKLFTDGWFVQSMPDLNQRNPYMATYLTQNTIWWIEYLGLAGLRIDTYAYSDPTFLTNYCKAILDEYPNLNMVGEQWHTMPAVVAYWQKGTVNKNGYVSYLPSLMDFPLVAALNIALVSPAENAWVAVYETLAQDPLYGDANNLMVLADNHDMSRIFTQVNENYPLFQLALAFICTTRGIPQILYGTEILMKNPGTTEHTVIRSDFPGGWEGDTINGFTGEGLTKEQKDAQDWIRKLLQWRKTAAVIHSGKLMHFNPSNGVYVYFRYDDDHRIMVVLNKNKDPYPLILKPYAEMLKGSTSGTDVLTGEVHPFGEFLLLDHEGPLILELN